MSIEPPLLRKLSVQEQALMVVEWDNDPVPKLNGRIYIGGAFLRVVGYYLADIPGRGTAVRVLTIPDQRPEL